MQSSKFDLTKLKNRSDSNNYKQRLREPKNQNDNHLQE